MTFRGRGNRTRETDHLIVGVARGGPATRRQRRTFTTAS
jgi:hypothetical protein